MKIQIAWPNDRLRTILVYISTTHKKRFKSIFLYGAGILDNKWTFIVLKYKYMLYKRHDFGVYGFGFVGLLFTKKSNTMQRSVSFTV